MSMPKTFTCFKPVKLQPTLLACTSLCTQKHFFALPNTTLIIWDERSHVALCS